MGGKSLGDQSTRLVAAQAIQENVSMQSTCLGVCANMSVVTPDNSDKKFVWIAEGVNESREPAVPPCGNMRKVASDSYIVNPS